MLNYTSIDPYTASLVCSVCSKGSRHCEMSVTGRSPDSHSSHLSVTVCLAKKVGKIGWFGQQQPFGWLNPEERPVESC